MSQHGNRTKAEQDLERREERVQKLSIRPLPPASRDRYMLAWHEDQARFVDDPKGAVMVADRLVAEVMRQRGYPVADFERSVEDISVDHAHLAPNYRAAREIVQREQRGAASTEDLRRALVHYRTLFDELLDVSEANH